MVMIIVSYRVHEIAGARLVGQGRDQRLKSLFFAYIYIYKLEFKYMRARGKMNEQI